MPRRKEQSFTHVQGHLGGGTWMQHGQRKTRPFASCCSPKPVGVLLPHSRVGLSSHAHSASSCRSISSLLPSAMSCLPVLESSISLFFQRHGNNDCKIAFTGQASFRLGLLICSLTAEGHQGRGPLGSNHLAKIALAFNSFLVLRTGLPRTAVASKEKFQRSLEL